MLNKKLTSSRLDEDNVLSNDFIIFMFIFSVLYCVVLYMRFSSILVAVWPFVAYLK